MARQDNPFALLGEDDDGSDVTVLIAKVEAKISTTAAPAAVEQQKPKAGADGFPSKPLPPPEYGKGLILKISSFFRFVDCWVEVFLFLCQRLG